ncbi:MAG: BsaWI family type II restriction enzyme [Roseinatronobacter sp.]
MLDEARKLEIISKCVQLYDEFYAFYIESGQSEADAQRHAISKSFEEALNVFNTFESDFIWRSIDAAHVKRKSGKLIEPEVIEGVRSATQSWNKSSGHAFEQSFCSILNDLLKKSNLRFLLQKEVSSLVRGGRLSNAQRDIDTLRSWLSSSAFDVFAVYCDPNTEKVQIFGCVQCKTSIRDRVTRDREPSIQAMNAFFWSIAVVIDGSFLRLPKFEHMVNGGSDDYVNNGWHGMYTFSACGSKDRIFALEEKCEPLVTHIFKAHEAFTKDRQWLDLNWRPQK